MTSYSQTNSTAGGIVPSSLSERYSSIIKQMPEELDSVLSEMMIQLDNISILISKINQSFQEHHKQVENFFQLVGIFSKSPRILEMIKAVQISTEKEAKQGPETMPPQDPEKPKATPGPQLFTRRQCLSETEEQQDPQPVWDKEPTFWSDTLTQELWKLFRENQQAQEEELLGLVSTLGWDPPTHICPTVPLPLHPCTLLGAAMDPQASAGFPWIMYPLVDPILSPRKTKTPA